MLAELSSSHAPFVLISLAIPKELAAMSFTPIAKYGLTMIQASKIPVSIVRWGSVSVLVSTVNPEFLRFVSVRIHLSGSLVSSCDFRGARGSFDFHVLSGGSYLEVKKKST